MPFCQSPKFLFSYILIIFSTKVGFSQLITREKIQNEIYTKTIFREAKITDNWAPVVSATLLAINYSADPNYSAADARKLIENVQRDIDIAKARIERASARQSVDRIGRSAGEFVLRVGLDLYSKGKTLPAHLVSYASDAKSLYWHIDDLVHTPLYTGMNMGDVSRNQLNNFRNTLSETPLGAMPWLAKRLSESGNPEDKQLLTELNKNFQASYKLDFESNFPMLEAQDPTLGLIVDTSLNLQKMKSAVEKKSDLTTLEDLVKNETAKNTERLNEIAKDLSKQTKIVEEQQREDILKQEAEITKADRVKAEAALDLLAVSVPLLVKNPKLQKSAQAIILMSRGMLMIQESTKLLDTAKVATKQQSTILSSQASSSALAGVTTLITAASMLMSLNTEDASSKMLEAILNAISQLQEQMHERFDHVDAQLRQIHESIITVWSDLGVQVENLQRSLDYRSDRIEILLNKALYIVTESQSALDKQNRFLEKALKDEIWLKYREVLRSSNSNLYSKSEVDLIKWEKAADDFGLLITNGLFSEVLSSSRFDKPMMSINDPYEDMLSLFGFMNSNSALEKHAVSKIPNVNIFLPWTKSFIKHHTNYPENYVKSRTKLDTETILEISNNTHKTFRAMFAAGMNEESLCTYSEKIASLSDYASDLVASGYKSSLQRFAFLNANEKEVGFQREQISSVATFTYKTYKQNKTDNPPATEKTLDIKLSDRFRDLLIKILNDPEHFPLVWKSFVTHNKSEQPLKVVFKPAYWTSFRTAEGNIVQDKNTVGIFRKTYAKLTFDIVLMRGAELVQSLTLASAKDEEIIFDYILGTALKETSLPPISLSKIKTELDAKEVLLSTGLPLSPYFIKGYHKSFAPMQLMKDYNDSFAIRENSIPKGYSVFEQILSSVSKVLNKREGAVGDFPAAPRQKLLRKYYGRTDSEPLVVFGFFNPNYETNFKTTYRTIAKDKNLYTYLNASKNDLEKIIHFDENSFEVYWQNKDLDESATQYLKSEIDKHKNVIATSLRDSLCGSVVKPVINPDLEILGIFKILNDLDEQVAYVLHLAELLFPETLKMNKDLFLKWKELKSMQVLANSQHKPLVCFLGSTFQFQNEPFASSWIEKFVPQGNVYWSDPKKLSDKAVMLYGDLYDLAKERVELGLPSPEMPAGFFENHKDLMSLRDFLN